MSEKPSKSADDDTPRSQTALIVCLGLVAALAPLSIDMYLPSFPTIREEFGGEPRGKGPGPLFAANPDVARRVAQGRKFCITL